MTTELPTRYQFLEKEPELYEFWERKHYFRANAESERPPFAISIPPPNITGSLHLGHALNNTLQDVLIRFKRMQGYEALWVPGTDHAGIATQNVVEKQLARDGVSRFELGRDKFLEQVWKWKKQYGDTIIRQLKRLGCSCDWSRTRFTLDEGYSSAVRKVFVSLYEKGLVYRDKYIINWCPRCRTALSDIEVAHEEQAGSLWWIRYPLEDSDEALVVATTRPETMLGDTAVAVHPEDDRYKKWHNHHVLLPLMGRRLPVVADEFVDQALGSGAVKVTPAHDLNDFECALRHNLPKVVVIDENGNMTAEAGPFRGLDRWTARKRVLHELLQQNLLVKTEDYPLSVGLCYRCRTVLEPYLSEQWFVRMEPLAREAIRVVEEGRIQFHPERWSQVYLDWLKRARDWCISRQIWWGHRLPVWTCAECSNVFVLEEKPSRCPSCRNRKLEQEPDVLDTWFSSALWPFATLGWPDSVRDLKRFYPTSVLVTARDILYLWVARMVFSSLQCLGKVPFEHVVINPTIQNPLGRRMSKSLGTGVDPLNLIEEYGSDATRLGLLMQAVHLQDIRFSPPKLEQARNFVTKIWNATRFALMNMPAELKGLPRTPPRDTFEDRWVLSRLQFTVEETTRALEQYRFADAAQNLYHFIWHELCDWYLEMIKPRLRPEGNNAPGLRLGAKATLLYTLETACRLLHPIAPFVTEEIHQSIRRTEGPLSKRLNSIMISPWPNPIPSWREPETEQTMERLMAIVRAIREIRASYNLLPSARVRTLLRTEEAEEARTLAEKRSLIAHMAGAESVELATSRERPPRSAAAVVGSTEVYVLLEGLIEPEAERDRIGKLIAKAQSRIEGVRSKLDNKAFRDRAPEEIVAGEQEREAELASQLTRLERSLRELETWG